MIQQVKRGGTHLVEGESLTDSVLTHTPCHAYYPHMLINEDKNVKLKSVSYIIVVCA